MRATTLRFLSLAAGALFVGACAGEEPKNEIDAAATPATAAYGYEAWDGDRDRRLTENEFLGVSRARAYNRWNTTADAGLDQNELGTGRFGLWDTDHNSQVTEEEWRIGTQRWNRPGINYGTFGDWNANGDGWLDQNELSQGLGRAGVYGAWDADRNNLVDDNELGRGIFDMWDANDDQAVDANKWDLGASGVDWF